MYKTEVLIVSYHDLFVGISVLVCYKGCTGHHGERWTNPTFQPNISTACQMQFIRSERWNVMLMQHIVTIFQRGLVKMCCRTNAGILQQLLKSPISQQTATAKGQNCWLLSELTAVFVSLFNKRPRHYCACCYR